MPNHVQAAAEGLPKFNRRKAFAVIGAGFVVPATAVAAAGAVASPSPIMALYAAWLPLYERGYLAAPDPLETDEELWARVGRNNDLMHALEDQIAALRARDAQDFVAKIVALTTFGEYEFDERREGLFAEARAVLS